jgi:hypothetical protein
MPEQSAPLGFSRDGDIVTIRMMLDDYANLLLSLGIAAGSASKEDKRMFYNFLALANRLNAGNPKWTPRDTGGEAEMIPFLRRLFCRHVDHEFVRNIYGDEINLTGGYRSEWCCRKCGQAVFHRDLNLNREKP